MLKGSRMKQDVLLGKAFGICVVQLWKVFAIIDQSVILAEIDIIGGYISLFLSLTPLVFPSDLCEKFTGLKNNELVVVWH